MSKAAYAKIFSSILNGLVHPHWSWSSVLLTRLVEAFQLRIFLLFAGHERYVVALISLLLDVYTTIWTSCNWTVATSRTEYRRRTSCHQQAEHRLTNAAQALHWLERKRQAKHNWCILDQPLSTNMLASFRNQANADQCMRQREACIDVACCMSRSMFDSRGSIFHLGGLVSLGIVPNILISRCMTLGNRDTCEKVFLPL